MGAGALTHTCVEGTVLSLVPDDPSSFSLLGLASPSGPAVGRHSPFLYWGLLTFRLFPLCQ